MHRLLFVTISLFTFLPFYNGAQHNHEGHEVEHLTFWDTFFGSEEDFMVCYPKDHQSFFYAIIVLTIASIFMAFFIFYSYRKYNRKLEKYSSLVQEKNTEMLDSIRYAQRIQNTILPSKEEFETVLPSGFVIYQPKDIVSGDFYWVKQVGNKKVIAVIDCTGHGVPGAFLSLIGHTALSRAVLDNGQLVPSGILHQMNNYVKQSLRQFEASDVTDGMEGAIVVLDEVNHSLQFAGARMNIIHSSGGELNLIRGSKLTVGTVEDHVSGPPVDVNISLNTGDGIYLYSDGVVDQFGKRNSGKFKISRLKELLTKVTGQSSTEQEHQIRSAFENWKGDTEQIDDLTIVGIKIDD